MYTPLNATNFRVSAVVEEAQAIRTETGIYEHTRLIEMFLSRAQEQFDLYRNTTVEANVSLAFHLADSQDAEFDTRLAQADSRRREAVKNATSWLDECYREIFYSEVMMRLTLDGNARDEKDATLLAQIKKLHKFTTGVVHVLEQDDRDESFTELTAELAELIAGWARYTLGPLDDDRYHHSDRARWITIHARAKRRMANLWDRSARADEDRVKAHARA